MTPKNRTPVAHNATHSASSLRIPVQFLGVGALFLLGLIALSAGLMGSATTPGAVVSMVFYLLSLAVGLRGLQGFPHDSIGLCNCVTVFRLMLVSGLIAALVTYNSTPWHIFAIASLSLILDGLDGWLARREGLASEFGARFDMEVDAVLALILSLHAYMGGHVGGFVLLLGLPRYVFWIAQFPMPWLSADLPERFSRKLVCVAQIAVLIAVLVPVLNRPLTDVMAGGVAVALIWSFGVDVRWLWRARA